MPLAPPPDRSLTTAEIAWLDEQVAALPGGWSLDVVGGTGDVAAVLLPEAGDRFAPAFLVDRVAAGYRLVACQWDLMTPVGVFASPADSLAHVAAVAAAAEAARPPRLQ